MCFYGWSTPIVYRMRKSLRMTPLNLAKEVLNAKAWTINQWYRKCNPWMTKTYIQVSKQKIWIRFARKRNDGDVWGALNGRLIENIQVWSNCFRRVLFLAILYLMLNRQVIMDQNKSWLYSIIVNYAQCMGIIHAYQNYTF